MKFSKQNTEQNFLHNYLIIRQVVYRIEIRLGLISIKNYHGDSICWIFKNSSIECKVLQEVLYNLLCQ